MRPLDIAVIILYLIGVVWAGLASRGKKGDSEEFFTSKGAFTGRLGMIMVGFSMAATLFSGVSYVIYTSVGFSSGAGIVMGPATSPEAAIILTTSSKNVSGHRFDFVCRPCLFSYELVGWLPFWSRLR